MRRMLATLLCLAASLGTFAFVEGDTEFVNQRVYFQCDGTTKVDDVNAVAGDPAPSWDTTPPPGSVEEGHGCGSSDTAFSVTLAGNYVGTDARWEGTFTGNLDNFRVEAHVLANAAPRTCGDVTVNPTVEIDGIPAEAVELTTKTTESSSGASHSVEFAVRGIGLVDDPEGPGTAVHDIAVELSGSYVDCETAPAWVWGTTEVPAGLEFNADVTGLPGFDF